MTGFAFELLARDGAARRGRLATAWGSIETPAFMPVGTAATVKALTNEQVAATGAEILLCNTYHLMLRPGPERIARLGGLHRNTFIRSPYSTSALPSSSVRPMRSEYGTSVSSKRYKSSCSISFSSSIACFGVDNNASDNNVIGLATAALLMRVTIWLARVSTVLTTHGVLPLALPLSSFQVGCC